MATPRGHVSAESFSETWCACTSGFRLPRGSAPALDGAGSPPRPTGPRSDRPAREGWLISVLPRQREATWRVHSAHSQRGFLPLAPFPRCACGSARLAGRLGCSPSPSTDGLSINGGSLERRCRLHGGLSTGPKAATGLARIRVGSTKVGRLNAG